MLSQFDREAQELSDRVANDPDERELERAVIEAAIELVDFVRVFDEQMPSVGMQAKVESITERVDALITGSAAVRSDTRPCVE